MLPYGRPEGENAAEPRESKSAPEPQKRPNPSIDLLIAGLTLGENNGRGCGPDNGNKLSR